MRRVIDSGTANLLIGLWREVPDEEANQEIGGPRLPLTKRRRFKRSDVFHLTRVDQLGGHAPPRVFLCALAQEQGMTIEFKRPSVV